MVEIVMRYTVDMAQRGQRKKVPLSPMHVEIGARLAMLRKQSGRTLDALGAALEPPMSPQGVELTEKGFVNTPIDRLAAMFEVVGATFVIEAATGEEEVVVARIRRALPYILQDEEDRLLLENAVKRGERRRAALKGAG